MGFLDEVNSQRKHTSTGCGLRKFLDTQSDLTDADIIAGIEAANIAATTRALNARGFKLGDSVVAKHSRQECSCRTF